MTHPSVRLASELDEEEERVEQMELIEGKASLRIKKAPWPVPGYVWTVAVWGDTIFRGWGPTFRAARLSSARYWELK